MPQNLTQRVVNTFIKGLVTEAGELTFPPDASVDELNCDLRRDGSRRRRKGIAKETNSVLSTFTVSDAAITTTGTWSNVGGQSGLEFLVFQNGATLYFYNKAEAPFSANQEAHTVNLATYETSGGVGASEAKCTFTSLKGSLLVVSPSINPIYIERDNVAETLTVTQIDFRTRDFDWQGDTSTYFTDDSSPSDERKYDAQNTGWNTGNGAPTDLTKRLTHPWYSGKDATGTYDGAEWDKIYTGTTLTGNGHYILDFFNKNRSSVSGISGLTTEVETSRFSAIANFSGRAFYAGLNSAKNTDIILFSQLITDFNKLGECLQQNDPTSEYISDLLDTDGGTIRIAGAVGIKVLYVIDASLYVFADNGVWRIEGIDGVFTPTAFAVKKVTDVGIVDASSFIVADGSPIWWSRNGIHTLDFDGATGRPAESNLTLGTIQSYWDLIPNESKTKLKTSFDSVNKRAYWAWPDQDEGVEPKVNNILVLDAALRAFYPWRIEDAGLDTDCVIDFEFYSGFGASLSALDVVTTNGDDVVTTAGDDVISQQVANVATGSPAIIAIIRDNATNKITMGSFSGDDFLDWGTTNYSSYAEAGYDFMGDLLLQKTAPYVTTYMRLTETAWEGNEETGYQPDNPSSMFVSSFWDFKSASSSSPQQAYRFKRMPVVNSSNLLDFNHPESVIVTRMKLRGKGRSMRIKFESEQGKDFILLGFSVLGGVNSKF
jgi:hypothetical protein